MKCKKNLDKFVDYESASDDYVYKHDVPEAKGFINSLITNAYYVSVISFLFLVILSVACWSWLKK
ncbi:hypothetical protein CRU79_24765 [Escherichia sp. E4385]|nr:hypothetical protein CRU79_24765 [Escherichia sp. E4385]